MVQARSLMASYLERWEEQKAQSRRERSRQSRRRSSDLGDELSFLSAIEREMEQEQPNSVDPHGAGRLSEQDNDEDFNFLGADALPDAPFAPLVQDSLQQTEMPADDEFVDAATFLKKNELGGDDSFSQDVVAAASDDWEENTSGRPSDFFEKKSRNLDQVELSSPGVEDVSFGEVERDDKEAEQMPKEQGSPCDPQQGVALHDRFDRSSGLSASGTALSSGYDVHFDTTRQVYTPNSMRYLQERNRSRRNDKLRARDNAVVDCADHAGAAKRATKGATPLPEPGIQDDISPEYVAALQRGPGVVKESLHEIDALIDSSHRLAASPPPKPPLGVALTEEMREFVRSYELPLESLLPLSRTTDSWGEDVSVSQVDDEMTRRRSRDMGRVSDLGRSSNGTAPKRPTQNGVSRSRSQETPELDTIREIAAASCSDSVAQSERSIDSHHRAPLPLPVRDEKDFDNENVKARSREPSPRATRASRSHTRDSRTKPSRFVHQANDRDRSLAEVAATQNPFRYESHHDDEDISSDQHEDDDLHLPIDAAASERDYQFHPDEDLHPHAASEPDELDAASVRFRYGDNSVASRRILRRKRVESKPYEETGYTSRTRAVQTHKPTSERVLDLLDRKHISVTIETAEMPRRCRRFLCSVGDVMTEQVLFTNGTNAVGRICVSLLPLSTGCQQFSVSPAVLELGPKASSVFHVTFTARYPGAVSGIFQFRGVGTEALFRPYEVVIEASVKRRLELENQQHPGPIERLSQSTERVQELQASTAVDHVEVSPMFLRFDRARTKRSDSVIRQASLRLANNTAHTLPFKVQVLENLKVRPAAGMIQPASEVIVSVLPISQPLAPHKEEGADGTHSPHREDWYGSLTVRIGKSFLREVSVVVDRRAIAKLPPFDEIARSRHQLSSQTDSFYYTKRGKRRGLYFHARAVEFGCCNVGEAHEVPVYVCNGSKVPMTVFLQELQEPFSCSYSTTTIEPRKFIEVMVTFTPKVVGKVATSLFAYSVNDKAVVTLVARGI